MKDYIEDITHGDKYHDHATCYDGVPLLTGCPEMDTVIAMSKNKDLQTKLHMYIKGDAYSSTRLDK